MRIHIVKPGLLSTIQDLGRHVYLAQAVPVSGVMDPLSARIANIAVGNNDGAAVIEFTYADAEFIAESDLLIAYCGDGAFLKTDELNLPAEKPVFIPLGTSVRLVNNPAGCRTYLAIAGGFEVPEVLGSRSTYTMAGLGGHKGRALQAEDLLYSSEKITATTGAILSRLKGNTISYAAWSVARRLFLPANRKQIRIVPGHEFNWFHGISIVDFLDTPYTLNPRSNRMGYHLEGKTISRIIKTELLSTAVTPGSIQVAGDGNMIMLMADCQTTGGYPRIAQVAAVDLPLCGQLKPGDQIYFEDISRQDAEMLYIERELELQELTQAICNRYL